MVSDHPLMLFALAAPALTLCWLVGHTGAIPHDDAMIVMRYVGNLLAGFGPVYNHSERVFGATSPFFVAIPALLALAGMKITATFTAIEAVSFVVSSVLAARTARLLGVGRLTTAALVLFLALQLHLTLWVAFGMGTAFYAMLMLASVALMLAGRIRWSFVFAWLVAVHRPDGLIFVAAMTLSYAFARGSLTASLKASIPGAAVFLGYAALMCAYYGRYVVQSMVAKAAQIGYTGLTFPRVLDAFFKFREPQWVVILVLFLIGAISALRSRREALAIFLFPLFYALAFSIARPPNALDWYNPPFYPLYLVGAAYGVAVVGRTVVNRTLRRALVVVGMIFFVGVIAILVSANLYFAPHFTAGRKLDEVNGRIGRWLAVNAKPNDRILAHDIGYIGYYSNLTVIDKAALVSPTMYPYVAKGDWIGEIRATAPEWVVLELYGHRFTQVLDSRWFTAGYREVRRFSDPDDSRARLPLTSPERTAALNILDYEVFRKK